MHIAELHDFTDEPVGVEFREVDQCTDRGEQYDIVERDSAHTEIFRCRFAAGAEIEHGARISRRIHRELRRILQRCQHAPGNDFAYALDGDLCGLTGEVECLERGGNILRSDFRKIGCQYASADTAAESRSGQAARSRFGLRGRRENRFAFQRSFHIALNHTPFRTGAGEHRSIDTFRSCEIFCTRRNSR